MVDNLYIGTRSWTMIYLCVNYSFAFEINHNVTHNLWNTGVFTPLSIHMRMYMITCNKHT